MHCKYFYTIHYSIITKKTHLHFLRFLLYKFWNEVTKEYFFYDNDIYFLKNMSSFAMAKQPFK